MMSSSVRPLIIHISVCKDALRGPAPAEAISHIHAAMHNYIHAHVTDYLGYVENAAEEEEREEGYPVLLDGLRCLWNWYVNIAMRSVAHDRWD